LGEWITSLGLDVGTSTTKLIVSRLLVSSGSVGSVWSDYRITEREVVYESPIHPTPLADSCTIDAEALRKLLEEELDHAQVDKSRVGCGAVIITGETAAKANAEEMVHWLSGEAGSFVTAAAGPDLEAVLAGKGSGAERRSMLTHRTVANIDVGGGTANVAYFRDGELLATVTFHVGGRLIRIDEQGVILEVASSLEPWLHRKGWTWKPGRKVDLTELEEVATAMAEAMLESLAGGVGCEADALCVGAVPEKLPPADEYMISGGVAGLLNGPVPGTLAEAARYGDIGPNLASALVLAFRRRNWALREAVEKVRATVIGAGAFSVELSGSTVHTDEGSLPLRNLPVLRVCISPDGAVRWQEQLETAVARGLQLFGWDGGAVNARPNANAPFALALELPELLGYAKLRMLADALAASARGRYTKEQTFVLVLDLDQAKALGQLLRLRLEGRPRIVCIDGVRLGLGDYIDIGEAVAGCAVPVLLKTLVFPGGQHQEKEVEA
jgi:ethanolamine utilization protein EutA